MERPALLQSLASRIAAIERAHPVRVAIDGVVAAGKTRLADELAPAIISVGRPVVRASIDGFQKWKFNMTDVTESGILTTASDLLFAGGRGVFTGA